MIIIEENVVSSVDLKGGTGKDVIIHEGPGGGTNNAIRGDDGDDYIELGSAIAVSVALYGGAHNDYIQGGPNNDLIYGGGGDDQILGNGGNDTIYGNEGSDMITGGSGLDNVRPWRPRCLLLDLGRRPGQHNQWQFGIGHVGYYSR